ncbi:hypothetical protein BJV82DRAFT_664006 [Fennellomyces sp. T-0311]|nr:hypothetical protein BJV82DRAFT_664006 [Fennellomyces sp. T-0311]
MSTQKAILFANNFWGKEDAGYEVLMHKMNMAKKTCEDLRSFYNAKASLHEDFGKKLAKQTKLELGREETGTIRSLLASAQKEMELAAQSNIELAQKIRSELEVSLDNFIMEQKDRRKLVQTNVDKAHRNKQLHAAHVTKAKEKYEAECAKQVSLESQLSTTTGIRETERLRQKVDRSQHEIKTLEKEYRNACTKLAETTAIWNNEWRVACDRFQDMEEKRIDFLHHSLCIYVNILSTASGQDQESYERFWKSLDQCNAKADIEKFIDEKGTGPMIPEPPVYVSYYDDPAKTLPRYRVAQFSESDNTYSTPVSSNDVQPSVTGMIKSTTKRSASFCEPKRRSSITQRVTKQLPPVRSATDEQIAARLDSRRMNLYTSTVEQPKKPAPAKPVKSTRDLHVHQDDEAIDPRAQVVFAIGNNMFEVGQNEQEPARRRSMSKKRTSVYHHNAEMEETFSDSIKGLLQELGVQTQASDCGKMRRRKSTNQRAAYTAEVTSPMLTDQYGAQMVWARALYDYHSEQPEHLSFSRGTWLAIVRNDDQQWWLAHKWDDGSGRLSETCGYVASNFVQICN